MMASDRRMMSSICSSAAGFSILAIRPARSPISASRLDHVATASARRTARPSPRRVRARRRGRRDPWRVSGDSVEHGVGQVDALAVGDDRRHTITFASMESSADAGDAHAHAAIVDQQVVARARPRRRFRDGGSGIDIASPSAPAEHEADAFRRRRR